MKKIVNLIVIVIIIITMQSCSSSYYPSHANVGMFRAKNELKANAGISASSANVDLSYSITDNFLITAGAFGFLQKDSYVNNVVYRGGKGYSFTVAPGFYKYFGKQTVFEALAGYGYNYTNSDDVEGNFHKFYIQPSIGLSKKYFELAFTSRLTTVLIDKNSFRDKRPTQVDMFIEPIGTIRAGGENFKVTTQIGFTIPTSKLNYQINPVYWSLGLMYHLRNKKAAWPDLDGEF